MGFTQTYKPAPQADVNAATFGLRASGLDTDGERNLDALLEAATKAEARGSHAYVAPGDYRLGRVGTTSVNFTSVKNLRLRGERGLTKFRAVSDIANGAQEAKGFRFSDVENLWLDGLTLDGGWNNASTEISPDGHLVMIASGTLPVRSTKDFPGPEASVEERTFELITSAGVQRVTYTNKTDRTSSHGPQFTGCIGGSGAARAGDVIVRFSRGQSRRTVALASNGANLSVVTSLVLHGDISEWPSSARRGQVRVRTTVLGVPQWEFLAYTSKSGQTLNGVSGPIGTVIGSDADGVGSGVDLVLGAGGQEAALAIDMQFDVKNHEIFAYGSDGNKSTPNRTIRISNCDIENAYGDGVWIGQETEDVTIENTTIYLAARNSITLSSYAKTITLDTVVCKYAGTTPLDSEPVEGPTGDLVATNCTFIPWPNPGTQNPNVIASIWGGADLRPAVHNMAHNYRFTNCKFTKGSVWLANARDCTFDTCDFDNDIVSELANSLAPVLMDRECSNIKLVNCNYYGRRGNTSSQNRGVISLVPYRNGSNSALVPGDIHIIGGTVFARGGLRGLFIEACGGGDGAGGTVQSYTAPYIPQGLPGVSGELLFTGTPFAGKLDYFKGKRVVCDGRVANVVGNTASKLYIAPIAENYTSGNAWSDHNGQSMAAPTIVAGVTTAQVLASGGWITVQDLTIDCGRTDDAPPGAEGVWLDTTSTWNPGYTNLLISLKNILVKNATGAAYRIDVTGPGAKALEIADCKWLDNQVPRTQTVGVAFTGAQYWERITYYGNHGDNGFAKGSVGAIPDQTGLEAAPYWTAAATYPPTYAGSVSPEGLVFAPVGSRYTYIPANVELMKQSPEQFATGWTAVKTAARAQFRAAGTMTPGVQNGSLTPTLAANVPGDVEFLQVVSLDSHGDVAFSTAAGFAEVARKADGVLRMTIFARRSDGTNVAPVINATTGGKFAIGRIYAVKDLAAGDPVTSAVVEDIEYATHAGGALGFTITAPTSLTANALALTFIATHTGASSSSSLASLVNAEPLAIEQTTHVDQGQATLGDRYTMAVVSARRVTAGSLGALTGTVQATTGSAFVMALTLALKTKVDA